MSRLHRTRAGLLGAVLVAALVATVSPPAVAAPAQMSTGQPDAVAAAVSCSLTLNASRLEDTVFGNVRVSCSATVSWIYVELKIVTNTDRDGQTWWARCSNTAVCSRSASKGGADLWATVIARNCGYSTGGRVFSLPGRSKQV